MLAFSQVKIWFQNKRAKAAKRLLQDSQQKQQQQRVSSYPSEKGGRKALAKDDNNRNNKSNNSKNGLKSSRGIHDDDVDAVDLSCSTSNCSSTSSSIHISSSQNSSSQRQTLLKTSAAPLPQLTSLKVLETMEKSSLSSSFASSLSASVSVAEEKSSNSLKDKSEGGKYPLQQYHDKDQPESSSEKISASGVPCLSSCAAPLLDSNHHHRPSKIKSDDPYDEENDDASPGTLRIAENDPGAEEDEKEDNHDGNDCISPHPSPPNNSTDDEGKDDSIRIKQETPNGLSDVRQDVDEKLQSASDKS